MRMICFECKKMIFQRGILLLILLLALINVGKTVIYLHYNPTVSGVGAMSREKGHRNVLKEYQGEMTEEKAKQLRKAQDDLYKSLTGDGEYHREDEEKNTIVNEYQYQYTYQFVMQEHLDAAGDNERFYQARGNTGQVRYNRLIRKLYGDRFIENFYQCSYYDSLFDYQFSTLLLLIFAGVLSLRFFYLEKECGMYQMLLSLGGARKKVLRSKYAVLFLGILGMGCLLYLQDFVLFRWMLDLHGIGTPIYAVQSYAASPYALSILGFYLMICGMRIAVIVLIALLMVLLEQMCSGKFLPVVAAGLVCMGVILTGDSYLSFGRSARTLHVVWLGDWPCPALLAGTVVYMILVALLSVAVSRTFRSRVVRQG